MNVAFLGLGGNLTDRIACLDRARQAISEACGKITAESSIYETESWGFESENLHLNQVIKLETKLTVLQLLSATQSIEKKLGKKKRTGVYTDRLIDIDILFFNVLHLETSDLILPHPRMAERKFVLQPLAEIAPRLIHPVLHMRVEQLLKQCKDKLKVYPFFPKNNLRYICIEGNIGSGKSSLAKALAKKLNATYLPEEFQKMKLLPLFYGDAKLYAFALEFSFMLNRFEEMSACFEKNQNLVVSDYSIYKSLWFAKINLKTAEYTLFKKQFEAIQLKLPKPDLIINLQTNTNNLLNNIKKRGRPFEQTISSDYLNKVFAAYATGYDKLKHIPKLSINVKKYHTKLEKEHIKKIITFIRKNFGETA